MKGSFHHTNIYSGIHACISSTCLPSDRSTPSSRKFDLSFSYIFLYVTSVGMAYTGLVMTHFWQPNHFVLWPRISPSEHIYNHKSAYLPTTW